MGSGIGLRALVRRLLGWLGNRPRVSFIVPFFASHNRLENCLHSIATHASLPYEILLIDDGNNGYDFSAVERLPHVRLLRMPHTSGPGMARNAGIEAARGSYVQFIDSDDEIVADPTQYFTAVEGLALGAEPDIITGHLEGAGGAATTKVEASNVAKDLRLIKLACFTAHLYRTQFLRDVEASFPPRLKTAEDTVFLAHTLPRAKVIATTNVALYRYHQTENGLSRKPVVAADFEERFGLAAPQIADALADFPEAQAARCSMLFKFAVMMLRKNAAVFDAASKLQAITTLAAFAVKGGLVTQQAIPARKAAQVYWGAHFDQCLALALAQDVDGFFSYIATEDIRPFKS